VTCVSYSAKLERQVCLPSSIDFLNHDVKIDLGNILCHSCCFLSP